MAIKKSDLYSSLWASCDELRDARGDPPIRCGENRGPFVTGL